jgi:phosphoglucosamine mutase
MSNLGLERFMIGRGMTLERTDVGDRYVMERMRQGGFNLGGEQSGHMIFLDHNTTGDGVLSALQVLAIVQRSGKPLSELAQVMTSLPQVLVNARVREKCDLREIPEIRKVIEAVEADLGENGRVLIRYSGTEPLLRVMIEGQDQQGIERQAEEIAELVRQKLGE